MQHPKDVGDTCTLVVMLALQSAGFGVLVPLGENTRYDLVIDRDGVLARVQCKSGRVRNGAVRFKTASSYAHHRRPKAPSRHYLGQVDYFAVYCRQTSGVYLIPIDELQTKWEGSLRVERPRNAQRRRVRRAEEYLVAEVGLESRRAATAAPDGRAGA